MRLINYSQYIDLNRKMSKPFVLRIKSALDNK